jgi:hypothetical protein
MTAKIAAAVLLIAAASAPAAIDSYMTFVTLPQPGVKLGDGSVLPAGKYEVEIVYKGFGNTAELRFFQGKVLKGTAPAEARGFPSQAPAGAASASTVKLQKGSPEMKEVVQSDVKITDPAAQKGYTVKTGEGTEKVFPKVETGDKWSPAGSPTAFNWHRAGFAAGAQGKASVVGRGTLKLSFDSANSAAGFSALLPVIQK